MGKGVKKVLQTCWVSLDMHSQGQWREEKASVTRQFVQPLCGKLWQRVGDAA